MSIKSTIAATLMAFLAFTFALDTYADEKVEWRDWDEGYEEAKENGKPILLSVYADWCGWCDRMDNDTYSDEEVADKIHENFVPIKFNPEEEKTYDMEGEELSGPQLLGALTQGEQTGYPTTLFLNVEERSVFMESGYKGPDDFRDILSEMSQKAS